MWKTAFLELLFSLLQHVLCNDICNTENAHKLFHTDTNEEKCQVKPQRSDVEDKLHDIQWSVK